jgi:hypothetical protein
MGFSEKEIPNSELLCHYCVIEQHYFRRVFGELPENEENLDWENAEKFWSNPEIMTGAFYLAQARERKMQELQAFMNRVKWKPEQYLVEEEK